jgi:hypothetical protein
MDEKHFKEHLKDLAHGHHHPEEHDWSAPGTATATKAPDDQRPNEGRAAAPMAKNKGTKKRASVKRTNR